MPCWPTDPESRVAVETMATTGLVHVAGEVTTDAYVEIPQIVRETILGIGYDSSANGFDGARCGVSVSIGQQSNDIAGGVFNSLEAREGRQEDDYDLQGAGDQGLMFGYASDETPSYMPDADLAGAPPLRTPHRSPQDRRAVLPPPRRQDPGHRRLRQRRPVSVETVVISSQHAEGASLEQLRADLATYVIAPVLAAANLDISRHANILNPAGEFVIGGPVGDAGLTGRKIIVDTYGGMARHGGGAFSGKDPSKVDRSAAYAMRWVAKNVVAAGLAKRAEIQIAYAIGQARPVGTYVETFGTETVDPARISAAIAEIFDLRPRAIIDALDLKRPIYAKTAAHGHFGRDDPDFTWERLDRVDDLKAFFNA